MDLKSLSVRLVGWFAKGFKINNWLILVVLSPAYLAFIWCFLSFKIYTMFCESTFLLRKIAAIEGNELLLTCVSCGIMSLFILWPLCRILQLSWPEIFEPSLDSNDDY